MSKFGRLPLSRICRRWLLPLILLMNSGLWADEFSLDDPRLQIHGFLTQAYVKTTANKFFGDSKDGSFEFRELGI